MFHGLRLTKRDDFFESLLTTLEKSIILEQRCPTHSSLATCGEWSFICGEWSFICGEWPYFQTPQNKAILDKAIQIGGISI